MPHLFDPFTVRSLTLRNRVGVSPMQQGAAPDGKMNDWHIMHLGGLAIGGPGLIIGECTAVVPEGRIAPGDVALWSDEFIEPIARVARFVKQYGAVFGLQLGHAGRRGSMQHPWDGGQYLLPGQGGWELVAPSAIAFSGPGVTSAPVPHELSVAEIAALVRAFADGARRALDAGVQWIEIHGGHGYLFHAFHSPFSNQRTDAYGGSFDNRIRFTLEVVRAMRAVWPDALPFSVRISCTEYLDGGWEIDDAVALSRQLKDEGVDVINCSSGAGSSSAGARGPGFQVPFAERIRHEAGIATAAVGRITSPEFAEEIVFHERADLVLLGRRFLYEPRWVMRAAEALGVPLKLPNPHGFYV
jgi:2,4-dienoyl-CoA reductase-like NADH-dependent reductase (Old Yellow Enzyme family)